MREMYKSDNLGDGEVKEIAVKRIHQLVNDNLKKEIEATVRNAANMVVEEVLKESYQNNNITHFKKSLTSEQQHARSKNSNSVGKVYTPRESLLTELLEVTHIRTIYHIFVVILIILFLNVVVYDFVDNGSINMGTELIGLGFAKMHLVIWIWCIMQAVILLPYPFMNIWANYRKEIEKNDLIRRLWDYSWVFLFFIYQISFITFSIRTVVVYSLPVASSIIITTETIRMAMKTHALVRSVSPRVLGGSPMPPFSCYLYFLFAPTLVYRDSYPRTTHIRWKMVMLRLLEIAAMIFYISFLCDRFLVKNYKDFGKPDEVFETKRLVLCIFSSILPALVTFLCGFYLLLHSWLNATAEIMTFADRQFYMDWWNQWSYGAYYRLWNMVVHDWLYTYIYMDILRFTKSRLLATIAVFTASSLFHEVILCFAFGFFYPAMMVTFGIFGLLLIFITKQLNRSVGNIYLWWSLAVGNGLLWSVYGMEYFARRNSPPTYDGLLDFIYPRTWNHLTFNLHPDWKFQNPFDFAD